MAKEKRSVQRKETCFYFLLTEPKKTLLQIPELFSVFYVCTERESGAQELSGQSCHCGQAASGILLFLGHLREVTKSAKENLAWEAMGSKT